MSNPTHPEGLTCQEAFDRLYEYLDRVLGPEEAALVRQHLAVCEECVRHFEFEEQLLATVRERCRASPAPAELKRKVEQLLDRL